jgi:single-stranded-DNA-specific exonuclease
MNAEQTKNWHILEKAPPEFLKSLPEPPLLLQILYNRGLREPQQIDRFLDPSQAVAENPYRLKDMTPAVTRIVQAIRSDETICVYGDFDADGVSATALLVTALQAAGARVGPYIPDRVDEGYGLNPEAIETIAEKASLMITVDCGIRSLDEAALARRLGLDLIITDHHSVGEELPPALAVINPRRPDCTSGSTMLAGVGVAFRLAQAVLRAVSRSSNGQRPLTPDQVAEIEEGLLEYVALGTVADIMPLTGENRSLVRRGLARLNRTERPGLAALIAQVGMRPGTVDAGAIAFRLGPRINAAGRLAHAGFAYRLLRTNDAAEAYTLAYQLEELNKTRRTQTEGAQKEAEPQLARQLATDPALLVVRSAAFHAGIVGLVAGQLAERYYRPAVVIEEGETLSRGSARSIEEFDMTQALDALHGMLVRHGGHSRAAGFTIETQRLDEFEDALRGLAESALPDRSNLRPTLRIDAETTLDQLNWGLREQFIRLEPLGNSNPAPLLLTRARLREVRTVGKGKHLRMVVDDGPTSPVLDAVAFNQGERAAFLDEEMPVELVFHLETNEYQSRQRLQLNVQDMRVAEE